MTQAGHSSTHTDDKRLNALVWRCIGPPRGGRVVAVAADPVNPAVFYFGACAGGVWKTDDAGTYWHNISDGYFKTASVGALAVPASSLPHRRWQSLHPCYLVAWCLRAIQLSKNPPIPPFVKGGKKN